MGKLKYLWLCGLLKWTVEESTTFLNPLNLTLKLRMKVFLFIWTYKSQANHTNFITPDSAHPPRLIQLYFCQNILDRYLKLLCISKGDSKHIGGLFSPLPVLVLLSVPFILSLSCSSLLSLLNIHFTVKFAFLEHCRHNRSNDIIWYQADSVQMPWRGTWRIIGIRPLNNKMYPYFKGNPQQQSCFKRE